MMMMMQRNKTMQLVPNSSMSSAASAQVGASIGTFELRFQCRKLVNLDVFSKTDAYVQVLAKDPDTGRVDVVGSTEVVADNLNPDFVRPVRVPYLFEVVQQLTFRVLDHDGQTSELVGDASCTLTDLVLSTSRQFAAPLIVPPDLRRGKVGAGPRGTIIVTADDVSGPRTELTLHFAASKVDKKDLLGKSDPFLVLYRVTDSNTLVPAAKTDVVKNTLDPTWRPLTVTSSVLYGVNPDALVEIQCFDWNKSSPPELIGLVRMPARELFQPGSWELVNARKAAKKKSYKNSGLLKLVAVQTVDVADFLDFVNAGLHMSVVVGIDCTASNGSPGYANSLHYLSPYQPNQYQRAISSVGSVMEPYDSNRQFMAFGYGGPHAAPHRRQPLLPAQRQRGAPVRVRRRRRPADGVRQRDAVDQALGPDALCANHQQSGGVCRQRQTRRRRPAAVLCAAHAHRRRLPGSAGHD
jgi:hypothetical protein